jgi:selenocysteine lyase/cysteine desulfurase
VRSFLDRCQLPEAADASQHHLFLDASRQAAVAEAARLLNAEPSQIALVESTTQGLNVAAGIVPLRAGDQVLIADTEFLQYFRTESASPVSDRRFVRTAKRFEVGGTSNYPGAVGLAASLRQINLIGVERIHAHILSLTEMLHEELARLGARVVSPREPRAARSGITSFRCHNNPAEDRALLERLLEAKVYLAMRYTSGVGGIRVSTHFFNNQEDIERLIAVVKKSLSGPDARD